MEEVLGVAYRIVSVASGVVMPIFDNPTNTDDFPDDVAATRGKLAPAFSDKRGGRHHTPRPIHTTT